MTTPSNPFPRNELPEQRRGEMRSFLIAEVMRDGRVEARRRPVFFAVTSAAAVGTLAVGAVLVGPHLALQPSSDPGAGVVSGSDGVSASASPGPTPVWNPSPTTLTGPHGATTGCDGMVLADTTAGDGVRYLPQHLPSGYALTKSWATVLDADCRDAGGSTVLQLFTRPEAPGRAAAVVAISTVPIVPGVPEPSATPAVTWADGITVAVGGRGHFVAAAPDFRVETAGLSSAETLAVARAAQSNAGKLLVEASPLGTDWSEVAIAPSAPAAVNWYAEFGNGTSNDAVDYQVHQRTADDDATLAFWHASGIATVTLGGHPAVLIDNGKGVRFVTVELTKDVLVALEVPAANGARTARDFVTSLAKVPADDPRIRRLSQDSPTPSPSR